MKPGLIEGKPNPELVKFMKDNANEFTEKGASIERSAVSIENDQNIFSVIGSLIERMIPDNVIKAASDNGSMLSLIFVSLLTAFGISGLSFVNRIPECSENICAQPRYRTPSVPAKIKIESFEDGRAELLFDEPQRALTPGQVCALYQDEVLIGGGFFESIDYS